MNGTPELTPFRIRVCTIEEGTGGNLRLPAFQTTAIAALARVDAAARTAELAWLPLNDGLNFGLAGQDHERVRGRLYEIAVGKLVGLRERGSIAACKVPVIDVALPCLDKRMAGNRSEYRAHIDGAPEYAGFAQAIASGWLASVKDETELPPMEWSCHSTMSGSVARALVPPLLESYGATEVALPPLAGDETYELNFTVSLDGAAAAGWYRLGSERTYDFFLSLARVSSATQAAIRRWLPVLWLGDMRMFDAPREAAALLAYASLPPVLARSRRNYTYDPVDAASLKQALLQCGRRIQRQLQLWYPSLAAARHSAAEQLHPRWHSRWAAEFTRRSKRIQTLLANEAWLIDQLVNFAAEFQPYAGASQLSGTIRRARATHAALEARLRRWWYGRPAQALAGLVLIEATSALTTAPVTLTAAIQRKGAGGHEAPIVLHASRGASPEVGTAQMNEAA